MTEQRALSCHLSRKTACRPYQLKFLLGELLQSILAILQAREGKKQHFAVYRVAIGKDYRLILALPGL